jgi:hypothetical protein
MEPKSRLFSPDHEPDIDPRDAIATTYRFLARCRDYARDLEIPKRNERFQADPSPELAAKLHQWATWVAFVEHAMHEIEVGTLDGWFLKP